MRKSAVNALLALALILPVVLFLRLLANLHEKILIAGAVAIAAGWILNVAWAFAAQKNQAGDQPADTNFVSIATRFGWICPTVLILLTWLVWRFLLDRGA